MDIEEKVRWVYKEEELIDKVGKNIRDIFEVVIDDLEVTKIEGNNTIEKKIEYIRELNREDKRIYDIIRDNSSKDVRLSMSIREIRDNDNKRVVSISEYNESTRVKYYDRKGRKYRVDIVKDKDRVKSIYYNKSVIMFIMSKEGDKKEITFYREMVDNNGNKYIRVKTDKGEIRDITVSLSNDIIDDIIVEIDIGEEIKVREYDRDGEWYNIIRFCKREVVYNKMKREREYWYRSDGLLHREDGPAVIESGVETWYIRGIKVGRSKEDMIDRYPELMI